MSIQTMLKFMNLGYIHYFEDIYTLKNHADEIRSLDGFGEKSCNNMLQAIEKSKKMLIRYILFMHYAFRRLAPMQERK